MVLSKKFMNHLLHSFQLRLVKKHRMISLFGVLSLSITAPLAQASCGASFCLVNTDWGMQGAWLERGYRLDLRFEQVQQDRLMRGSETYTPSAKADREMETISRRWHASFEHGLNQNWAYSVSASFLDRSHSHTEDGAPASWQYRQPGDLKVQLNYQNELASSVQQATVYGLKLGLKLPTASIDIRNSSGSRAERSLQPGSGTTDLLGSVYYRRFDPESQRSWFVQANFELPLQARSGYKPGRRFGIDAGLSLPFGSAWNALAQINLQQIQRDSGSAAEPDFSGGRVIALSPGLSYRWSEKSQVYGYLQVPVYQYLNGQQLATRWALSAGWRHQF